MLDWMTFKILTSMSMTRKKNGSDRNEKKRRGNEKK